MSRRRITYLHIFIWLFAIFANLPFKLMGQPVSPQLIVSNVIGFLYLMVVFYLFYLVLAPRFLNKRRLTEFLTFSLAGILILPFFGYTILFLSRAVFDGTFHGFYRGYSLKMHMSAFYPVLTAAVFGSFFSVIVNWFTTMNQKAEMEKQKLAIELTLLKSKLNPHFLFNTLNNIDSLIYTDQEKASASLIKLSDMMRYLTYETSREYVKLGSEVAYIRNFIDLHRMRIRDPNDITFSFEGDENTMISPALFVPLIENAFKFGCFGAKKPCIQIRLFSKPEKIIFEISNIFKIYSKTDVSENSGFGLINLRKRLELSYPGAHSLEINENDSEYKVLLTLDTCRSTVLL